MEPHRALHQIPESLTRRVVAAGMTICANDERGAYLASTRPAAASEPALGANVAALYPDTARDEEVLLERMRELPLC